jgi:hypothetical protein
MNEPRLCIHCGKFIGNRHGCSIRCRACQEAYEKAEKKAYKKARSCRAFLEAYNERRGKMICPKCGKNSCRYNQRREDFQKASDKKFKRTDFSAKCTKCNWEGEI